MHAAAGLWHALTAAPTPIVQAGAFGTATVLAMTGVGMLLGLWLARR